MSWRTVIVANHAKLDLQVGFMQVRSEDGVRRVILDEIDMLIVESTAVSLTSALLAELVKRKIGVVFCDGKRLPVAGLQPFNGCHDSARKIRLQLAWTKEVCGIVWRRIIVEKITNQAKMLLRAKDAETANLLFRYAQEVEIEDSSNREGLAAKVYFPALFGQGFVRENSCDANSALDYGYQVMLAVFARELAAEGYITQLGIFHDNVYNNYNLACDLMEPFRPLVDWAVREWYQDETHTGFEKDEKRMLVSLLHREIKINGNNQTLINAIISYTRSVTEALNGGDVDDIRFPEM